MGNLIRFFLYCSACFLGAALVAPCLYLLAQETAAHTSWAIADYLAKHPFHRYFNRSFQLFALMGFWWVIKKSGVRSPGDLGFQRTRALTRFSSGFLSSCLFVSGFLVLLYFLDVLQLREDHTGRVLLRVLPKILATALVVSVIEEAFFRGYFYRISSQALPRNTAVALNALFFSSVHYLKPHHLQPLEQVGWLSGFHYIGQSALFTGPLSEISGGLTNLILIAIFLCWSVDFHRSILHAMGLHAGWIVMLQASGEVLTSSSSLSPWLLGGGNLSQGILTIIPLGTQFGWFVWRASRKKSSSS